ncbi:TetR/AcrR family transcriptional regulator [Actinosynnema sp. NPDC047251]|uniref:Transcriptional regulator, TetR family n=1 Tax=Saccharothrix espanaensis (strain ATCC 51144 / DSM 44229 / JCM 9112 / NBRC 15066 / NRRL 15764) TaxID=1179773 RepID=K0K838_SACES|nr:TetR/AcrR family transcriptional regulator [Saccharothrix espanaensis]CCH32838.1 Transcriptional regulator, TetR family [Saccharothrix espanaensis DSM 44229]
MDDAKTRTRRQVIEVAAGILEREGAQAVSTRSVAAAAGIRAASLYQLFGDKDGLLAALASHAFERYLSEKHTLVPTDDPVGDLRRGWDIHVDFGLRHPAFYLLMFGTDRPGRRPPAADEAHGLLLKFLDRAAAAGRLRVPPALAAHLCLAAVTGVTLSLIGAPAQDRDPEISARMRDTLIGSLTTDPPPPSAAGPGLASRALALDAALTAVDRDTLPMRSTETALLRDWLHQLAR